MKGFRTGEPVLVSIFQITPLSISRVLESVHREQGMGLPVDFVRLNRYVIRDAIVHVFTVCHGVNNSWYPELLRVCTHPFPLRTVVKTNLLM